MALLLPGAAFAGAHAQAAQPPAEAVDNVEREVQAAQDALARAIAEFDGPQQSRSIVAFDEVISRLETLGTSSLSARGREMLAQAYEYRGRAYFGIGLSEKASENFRVLVRMKPDYSLAKDRISPKVIELYNSVKRALVGYLAVATRPAGARVTLIGPGSSRSDLGLTDFFPLEILAGDYTVEIAKPGYQTVTKTVSVAARDTATVSEDLVRVLASVFLVTEPSGVEVWLDGELRTTTAGSLSPEFAEAARARGLDPSKASGRTELANLSLGSHTLELRHRCYETVKRTVDTAQPQDYEVEPVRLEDSLASLRLVSDPPGAKIFLNGAARGETPAQVDGLCSGKVRVEVKHAAGKFIKDLVLAKDESVSLECPIRPTLAFLGTEAEGTAGQRYLADATEKIEQNLAKLSSLNFITAPRETVDRILEQEKLTRRSLLPGNGASADQIRKVTERLAAALEVQGFLIALLPEERLQRTARLHLLAAGNISAEAVDIVFAENAAYGEVVSRLDGRFASRRPWTGIVTADTLLEAAAVPVIRVVAASPAAAAGLQPGDVVMAADGKPVKSTADLLAAVAARKPGDKLILQVRGGQRRGAARRRPRARRELARDSALRPAARLQQGHDGPALGRRGLPRDRAGGLRVAQPGAVRDALLRLCRRPRVPAEGAGRAAAAAGALARHGDLLPRTHPREAGLQAAGGRRLQVGGRR